MRGFVRIALIMDYQEYPRSIAAGLARYARPGRPWFFHTLMPQSLNALDALHKTQADAVVAQVASASLRDELIRFHKPVVNISAVLEEMPLPTVCADNFKAGKLAADYLIRLGLRHLGFLGDSLRYARLRGEGVRAAVRSAKGVTCSFYSGKALKPHDFYLNHGEKCILAEQEWLAHLPRPSGIVTVDDQRAVAVTELARRASLDVPRQTAVVGIGNMSSVCETGWPPVSSVEFGGERIGFEVGRLLEHLLAGGHPPQDPILVPPAEVKERGSATPIGEMDDHVALAAGYIQDRFCRDLKITEIARAALASRRSLERKFRQALGCSIMEYVRRLRLKKFAFLLRKTGYSISETARLSGFGGETRMRELFRHYTGMSPSQYRRNHTSPHPPPIPESADSFENRP